MCEKCAELLRAYQKALAMYSCALEALDVVRPTDAKRDYNRLLCYVDDASLELDRARNALKAHAAEHGCFPSALAAKA